MVRLYTDPDILQAKIDEYFDSLVGTGDSDEIVSKPPTHSGLAYFLGFSRRATINDYAKRDDQTSVPMKRALLRLEEYAESRLYGSGNCTGAIFALKNKGWSDKQVIEMGEIGELDKKQGFEFVPAPEKHDTDT